MRENEGVYVIYRLFKIFIFVYCIVIQSHYAYAGVKEDYEDAKIEYVSSLVSMATYSDRAGISAREELADSGWFMRPYNENFHGIAAKFFVVANNDYIPGEETYILAVTGTESIRDIKADLSFSKVLFGGNTPDAFLEKAETKHLTSADPMVHRGFNKYANTAFFTKEFADFETYGEYLAAFLKGRPNRKLYMVGHSLGGAVATIAAARLISLGVDPNQLEVITFGAPAVGNDAFAKQFGKDISLKRVVMKGDPVKGVLQSITGGYTQFGRQVVRQEALPIYNLHHAIGTYVDASIRNYYDARQALEEAGYEAENSEMSKYGDNMVYFSPVKFQLDATLSADQFYMQEIAADTLRHSRTNFVFGEGARETLAKELAKAKAVGSQWLVQGDFSMEKVQNQYYTYYVSYQENIYEVKSGKLKDTLIFSNGTGTFTPLQSVIHNLSDAEELRLRIIK